MMRIHASKLPVTRTIRFPIIKQLLFHNPILRAHQLDPGLFKTNWKDF